MVLLKHDSVSIKSLPHDKLIINKFLSDNRAGFSGLAYPDFVPGANKEIDAVFSWNGKQFALEHTTLVRFKEERAAKKQFLELKEGLKTLGDLFPSGHFTVLFSCKDYGGKAKRKKLIEGVMSHIPPMAAGLKPGRGFPINVAVGNIPVYVYRHMEGGDKIELKQFNPESKVQYPDTKKTVISKFEKLKIYKEKGFSTLLLLETSKRDTDTWLITDALIDYEKTNGIVLDELWQAQNDSALSPYTTVDLKSYRGY